MGLSKKGAQKSKTAFLRLKLHFAWRKSTTKFLFVNAISHIAVRHSLPYLSVQNGSRGTSPNFAEADQSPSIAPISDQYSLVAPQL